eukprot:EC798422.1.p3 GENE.EC798422.1~~EC798422.1.p3  ORF type:complete len:67 (-),score=14.08 EC798422.1:234-434(-)
MVSCDTVSPIHYISSSTYSGADTFTGFFTLSPSAHKYSYLGPAFIVGHVVTSQNPVVLPYNKLVVL